MAPASAAEDEAMDAAEVEPTVLGGSGESTIMVVSLFLVAGAQNDAGARFGAPRTTADLLAERREM